jgi:hypothetical protein
MDNQGEKAFPSEDDGSSIDFCLAVPITLRPRKYNAFYHLMLG